MPGVAQEMFGSSPTGRRMQSRFLGQNIPKLQWRKGPGGARLIQTDFSHPEWQLWEYFLVWLALLASYPSSGFKALLYSAQLIKRGTQIAGIKATNISPATARVQQVKPLDNRDGISQMNWITPRNSAWLTGEQGQELGVLLPPTLLLTLDLGSVITVPGADSDWGNGGAHQAGRRIIL